MTPSNKFASIELSRSLSLWLCLGSLGEVLSLRLFFGQVVRACRLWICSWGYCSKYSEKLGSWMLAKLRLWAAGDEHSQPSSILDKFIDSIGVKNGQQPTPSCFFPWKIFNHGKSTPRFLWPRVQMFSRLISKRLINVSPNSCLNSSSRKDFRPQIAVLLDKWQHFRGAESDVIHGLTICTLGCGEARFRITWVV